MQQFKKKTEVEEDLLFKIKRIAVGNNKYNRE